VELHFFFAFLHFFFAFLHVLSGLLALFSVGNARQIAAFIFLIPNLTYQPLPRNTTVRCQLCFHF